VNFHDKQAKPFHIDFNDPALQKRMRQFGAKQLLAKAVGYKPGKPLKIIDATAGLGRDSLLLASLGCEVTMLEQSPVLAALLQEALEQSQQTPLAEITNRLQLVHTDSAAFLKNYQQAVDTIYLDPMFPERKKSALVKKDMQILQDLIGHNDDNQNGLLLESALAAGAKRVVVKRPRLGEVLPGPQPNLQFISKTHRFDTYI
jgi:16S rRNA (guanine1516-N2)-methyltransferase